MKIAIITKRIMRDLEWVSELEDIDHDICDAALDAKDEILRLSRIIEELREKSEKDKDTSCK